MRDLSDVGLALLVGFSVAAFLAARRRLGARYENRKIHKLVNKATERLHPGSVVVDIPCGTGRIDSWLRQKPVRVIAADISGEMLRVARQRVRPASSRLEFIKADATHLPFQSSSVDGVFCIRFLHLVDPAKRLRVLSEVARIVKEWAVIEYRNYDRPIKVARRRAVLWLTGQVEPRKMSLVEIAAELSACGLNAERCCFVSRWFSGSVLILARRT